MRNWLTKPVHISWHISGLSYGFVAGVAGSPWLAFYGHGLALASGAVVFCLWCGLMKRGRWRFLLFGALLIGAFLGWLWGGRQYRAFQAYTPYVGVMVQARGMVAEDISRNSKGETHIAIKNVWLEHAMQGNIWLSTRTQRDIKRGDIVTVKGILQDGFGALPASLPRAEIIHVEHPHPGDVARRMRDWFTAAVQKAIPGSEGLLGIGYLTGQRSNLPESLDDQLRSVGLTHAVVASGYNLTILVAFARRSLLNISKYAATMAACGMIGAFILVTGLSPSMSRAGLVTAMSLAAWYYGRVMHPGVLLPVAATVTLIMNPSYIWGDFGWYLSFLAFVGVVVLAPLFKAYLWPANDKPPTIPLLVMETIAAQIVTVPVTLYGFGQYASFALLANILVLPFVPLTMVFTFLGGVASLLLPGLSAMWGLPAYTVLHYMVWVVQWVAELPGASYEVHFGLPWLLGSYVLLVISAYWLRRVTGHSYARVNEFLK